MPSRQRCLLGFFFFRIKFVSEGKEWRMATR
nr:MAG TPA: hypothetical protein [Caudoviricetes sp.]